MIRVILADDQAIIRSGIGALLDLADDIAVVGEASDGHEAVALARTTRPDVVLMDLQMPRLDGVEATRRIRADPELAHTAVLVLTTFDTDEAIADAIRAGAGGFLGKTADAAELVAAVRSLASGIAPLSTQALESIVKQLGGKSRVRPHNARIASLTERERELTILAARGLSNADIAARLVLSPATVKTHINRAMTKLGVSDRSALVILVIGAGIVDP